MFGQDGWILASFFCVFMADQDEVEVHKNTKKELGQYPAILTEQAWSWTHIYCGVRFQNKPLLYDVVVLLLNMLCQLKALLKLQ